MKKKLALLISLMMVMCLAVAACGGNKADLSDSEYVGEWVCNSMTAAGESGDIEGGVWTLTLKDDGTGTFVSTEADGTEETSNITWELTDEGFKTKGDTKLKFAKEDSGIKTSFLGVELHFIRADEIGPDDGAPDAGAKYGYMGQDPAELAVYKYLCEEVAADYETDGLVTIPLVQFVNKKDGDNGEILFYGDYWINNCKIEGDTLVFESGGNHPGLLHVVKDGDEYKVTAFDQVKDGGDFDSSAKEIFGDDYDKFIKIQSDSETRDKLEIQAVTDYVKTNGLTVTKYQPSGMDPVDLDL